MSYIQRHRRLEREPLRRGIWGEDRQSIRSMTLRVGPFALIPPFVIVKLGRSLHGDGNGSYV